MNPQVMKLTALKELYFARFPDGRERQNWPGLTTTQSLAVASQFGVTLAIGVALGLVAGQWLDGQMHTGYVFTLIGVFAGLILGSISIVALYRATLRSSEREWHDEANTESKKTRPLPAWRQHT